MRIPCRKCSRALACPKKMTNSTNASKMRWRIADRARANGAAARLLNAIHSGERPELGEYRYYALTLSANSGRVVIRDWMEGQFTELLEAVNALVRRPGNHPSYRKWICPTAKVRGSLGRTRS